MLLIISFSVKSSVGVCLLGGETVSTGLSRLKMRVEDHFLVKKMDLNLTADEQLALAA